MKQGTQTHPKFKSLAKALKIHQYEAVGILESIWMMACQFSGDDGDLSRFTPQEIADWMDWSGDSKELIDALVGCRWLDSIDGSLKVHDWMDHRPHYLKDRFRKQQDPKNSGRAATASKGFLEAPGSSRNFREVPGVSDPSLVQSSPVPSSPDSKGTDKRFKPPTVQEVREYGKTQALPIDADLFVDHYEANGWLVGKTKMKNWQAAVRKWARNSQQQTPKTLSPQTTKGIDFVN